MKWDVVWYGAMRSGATALAAEADLFIQILANAPKNKKPQLLTGVVSC